LVHPAGVDGDLLFELLTFRPLHLAVLSIGVFGAAVRSFALVVGVLPTGLVAGGGVQLGALGRASRGREVGRNVRPLVRLLFLDLGPLGLSGLLRDVRLDYGRPVGRLFLDPILGLLELLGEVDLDRADVVRIDLRQQEPADGHGQRGPAHQASPPAECVGQEQHEREHPEDDRPQAFEAEIEEQLLQCGEVVEEPFHRAGALKPFFEPGGHFRYSRVSSR